MTRKKWFLLLTAVGLCIIFFAIYFINLAKKTPASRSVKGVAQRVGGR
ncbi:hypothetical protein BCK_24745 [Bacillus cereus FRI-35]|nr:hypothetical protein BCK_24745 [Bacillus cereus FRI-35]